MHCPNQVEAKSPADDAAELKTTICAQVAELCAEHYDAALRALILTGSLARDEATYLVHEDRWRLAGDAEFLLIFHSGAPLPPEPDVRELGRKCELGLFERGIECRVDLSTADPAYLASLEPHIFAIELRLYGQVVLGDAQVLSLIPEFSSADIPLEDAWRLLSNRMIEHLEAVATSLPEDLFYRTIKLYLDMATSLLVFTGAYAPTYAGRARNLRVFAASTPAGDWPFPLEPFAGIVTKCTDWKLNDPPPAGSCCLFWRSAVHDAQRLWHWELARLCRASDQPPGRLMRQWTWRQPLGRGLRGWLYVLRRTGWHRGWRHWGRWARLGRRASPRYCIYAAAVGLYSRLPGLVETDGGESEPETYWKQLSGWLPLVRDLPGERWRRLASDIAWNYKKFLVGTRA